MLSAYTEGLLIIIGINVLLGLGYWITVNTGQFSFGHAGFMAIGAYLSSILTLKMGWPLVPAALIGGLVSAGVGGLVALPAGRLSLLYLAMATMAFAELTQIVFENWTYVGGPNGLAGMRGTSLPLVAGSVVVLLLVLGLFARSRLGLTCAAVRDDEYAARAAGLNVTRVKVLAFAVGALVTGVAGALYAHQNLFIEPSLFGVQESLIIILYVVFGGIQTLWGPVVGSIILTLFPEVFAFVKDWFLVLYGALFVVLMMVRPQGLIARR